LRKGPIRTVADRRGVEKYKQIKTSQGRPDQARNTELGHSREKISKKKKRGSSKKREGPTGRLAQVPLGVNKISGVTGFG